MDYIGSIAKSVVGLYSQINSATLSGAIDVMVVKQMDGSYVGSPFHVRFGKLGVMRSSEKIVDICVNGREVDLKMKLGRAGEAFFVESVTNCEDIPCNLATSPIPSSMHMFRNFQQTPESGSGSRDDEERLNQVSREGSREDLTSNNEDYNSKPTEKSSPLSQSIPIPGNKFQQAKWKYKQNQPLAIEITKAQPCRLSDLDSPISSPLCLSPILQKTPVRNVLSDTEIGPSSGNEESDITWEWGRLPENTPVTKTPRSQTVLINRVAHRQFSSSKSDTRLNQNNTDKVEGLLLDDILAADQEVADMYLNRAGSLEDRRQHDRSTPVDHNITPVPTTVPTSPLPPLHDMIIDDDKRDDTLPLLDEDRDLGSVIMSLCGELKNRRIKPDSFDNNIVSHEEFCGNPLLLSDPKLVIQINNSYYNWSVAAPYLLSYVVFDKPVTDDCLKSLKQQFMPRKRRGWWGWSRVQNEESSDEENPPQRSSRNLPPGEMAASVDDVDSDGGNLLLSDNASDVGDVEYRKTLRLTSQQISQLDLQYGENEVTFTVTSRLQGTATCAARIFLWGHTDRIIISDIDGTITRSDVLGQILPQIGKDWSQIGVTELFTHIERNGYKFVYLSARAIGQASMTRYYLDNVRQGEMMLPDGPLFLSPTSLFVAFKKEVIEKKPEEFKISCMRDIQMIFPPQTNPFYAGFGNRVNDVWAYRAVGIPISRIFTINHKGEITHEPIKTLTSSYCQLIELVDQMFPPVSTNHNNTDGEYTSFRYWRTPVQPLTPVVDEESIEFP